MVGGTHAVGSERLTRRPGHTPATQQMQMQMIHRLPSIVSSVHDDPVAFAQLLVARNRVSGGQ